MARAMEEFERDHIISLKGFSMVFFGMVLVYVAVTLPMILL